MKIKVTYPNLDSKEATELINDAVARGAVWEICESSTAKTQPAGTARQRRIKTGDRIVVTRTLSKYGIVRGDRGVVTATPTNGRKRQSFKVDWDDGTTNTVPGGAVRRTTK